ncbi:MAG: NAD(P)/FAD-dependent oxidoreductase [Cyanobacteria bacterium P01_C01_bin.89]
MANTLSQTKSSASGKAQRHQVVIVGGGFGGLYAAKALGSADDVDVTIIDRRNFHLFQPLLYQVATGTVSPADIASPLRVVVGRNKNTQVIHRKAVDINTENQTVMLDEGEVSYDTLLLATGGSHHYFGNDQWKDIAPGLKTVEDALEIRRRIFSAFEKAEQETDAEIQKALLTFVIVGAGPTGVELAGAIAEIAHGPMRKDFSNIDTTQTKIILVEGMDRVLPPYAPDLSADAQKSLEDLGVTVRTKALVTEVTENGVSLKQGDNTEWVSAKTVLWAAGVRASAMGKVLSDRTGVELDRAGRVVVEPDLSVAGHPNIFVVGDLANFPHQGERPLPGVAPVAMQEGEYVAKLIKARQAGNDLPQFVYNDFGSMAVIGRNSAVADLKFTKFSGPLAWFVWIFAHIYYLIEFDNKLVVLLQWGWNYFTKGRGARLITGEDTRIMSPSEAQEKAATSAS